MLARPHSSRSFAPPQWPASSAGRFEPDFEPHANATRDGWMMAFVERLGELRPEADEDVLAALAAELWEDVGSHDPLIAAEMEHEASFGMT